MEYLFLKRKKSTAVSKRQKRMLLEAAEQEWKELLVDKGGCERKMDGEIYKCLLYLLEIKQIFLDSKLSLKKIAAMIQTNQTYISNVVNKYFKCNLKGLVNSYRIEYAKELLCAEKVSLRELHKKCGFASRSTFYAAFDRIVGMSPSEYLMQAYEEQGRGK